MKTNLELMSELPEIRGAVEAQKFNKTDDSGHIHDSATGQFTGSGGGHKVAKVGDTISFKTRDFGGAPPLGTSGKKKSKKAKILKVYKDGDYETDQGMVAAKDVTEVH